MIVYRNVYSMCSCPPRSSLLYSLCSDIQVYIMFFLYFIDIFLFLFELYRFKMTPAEQKEAEANGTGKCLQYHFIILLI